MPDDNFIDDSIILKDDREHPQDASDTTDYIKPSLLMWKPLYLLSTWRDARTRDGRISIIIVLPTGALELQDSITAEVIADSKVNLAINWSTPATDVQKLVSGILAVEEHLEVPHGSLMEQGLHDFLSQDRSKESDPIASTCIIELPYPVKPDFSSSEHQKRTTELLSRDCVLIELVHVGHLTMKLQK